MKKNLLLLCALFALLLVAAACAQAAAPTAVPAEPTTAPTEPTAAPTETVPAGGDVVLDVIGESKSISFSMDTLKALPAVEGQAGIKSSTGKITPPALFKGVSLLTLIEQVGGLGADMGVEIEAEDGYIMTFSADQLVNGAFIAYDPATGDELKTVDPLTVIIAYEMDGQPLDEQRDGKLRLAIISEKNNQVTDGHWSIKWVRRVTLKSMAEDWVLELQGALDEPIDRGSYESCSASGCHGATWTDTKAQEWSGTPLWIIVGRVDDEFKHGSDVQPYNRELAEAGYTIEVVAADGYSVTFDSQRISEDNAIILANKVNGNMLAEGDSPLRLVGPTLTGKESIGAVVKIILPPNGDSTAGDDAAAATRAVAPAGEEALTLVGLVNAEQSWSRDMLEALGKVKLQLEHPKKGMQEYEGAAKLVLTASDGYAVEADLAAVLACADCLVAFADDGTLVLAMPGMESSFWVKDVVRIEVK